VRGLLSARMPARRESVTPPDWPLPGAGAGLVGFVCCCSWSPPSLVQFLDIDETSCRMSRPESPRGRLFSGPASASSRSLVSLGSMASRWRLLAGGSTVLTLVVTAGVCRRLALGRAQALTWKSTSRGGFLSLGVAAAVATITARSFVFADWLAELSGRNPLQSVLMAIVASPPCSRRTPPYAPTSTAPQVRLFPARARTVAIALPLYKNWPTSEQGMCRAGPLLAGSTWRCFRRCVASLWSAAHRADRARSNPSRGGRHDISDNSVACRPSLVRSRSPASGLSSSRPCRRHAASRLCGGAVLRSASPRTHRPALPSPSHPVACTFAGNRSLNATCRRCSPPVRLLLHCRDEGAEAQALALPVRRLLDALRAGTLNRRTCDRERQYTQPGISVEPSPSSGERPTEAVRLSPCLSRPKSDCCEVLDPRLGTRGN